MSGFHARQQRFKGGGPPPVAPPRRGTGSPVRRGGKQQATERDLTRFTTYLDVERGVSPLTKRKYVPIIKRLKGWARRKRKSLLELTATDCRRWLIGLAREMYSPSTINGMLSAANIFFRFLIKDGDLITNPFEQIPYMQLEKPLPRFLHHEQAEQLMLVPDTSTYAGLLDRAMMELLYSSGMRVAELINLRLNEINVDRRLIRCMGKGSKQRIVIYGRSAGTWLKKYLEARARVPGADKSPYVFLKSDGKRVCATYIWRHIREHGLMVGLKDVSPRVLRHSFATNIHAGGANIRYVQMLLGHEDMESTQVYTHLVQAHLRKTYDQHHPRARLTRGPPHRKRCRHDAEGEDSEK